MSDGEHVCRGPARSGRPAFTLVELLVVVSIIALLVTILVPSLGRAKELARRTICATNLRALGIAWRMYFEDSNGRTPQMFNLNPDVADTISQYHFLIWCDRYRTSSTPDFINAGVLYKRKLVGSEQVYVCPTMRINCGGNWFHPTKGAWHNMYPNPWPPEEWKGSRTTYGRRRMKNYDDSTLSGLVSNDPRDDHIMIWSSGVNDIRSPSDFSFMTDNFMAPDIAMLSHVPGVNVMYLDSHVEYWPDDEGTVLYDNGITGWDTEYNWLHDDVWMIIDGYHQPPVGQ